MRYLRTVPTRRLVAMIAGLVVAVVVGSAIAVAATSGGATPPRSSLAAAIHRALGAKPVDGLSADVSFTNGLISSADVQTSDPIITGASGRIWITPDHMRLELRSANGQDAQIVVDHNAFWIYDPAGGTVYKGTLPADHSTASAKRAAHAAGSADTIPTVKQITSELTQLATHLTISGARPTNVGGAAAYRVRVAPKHDGGLLGAVALAWDATHGVPLDFAVYASGSPSPVLELQVTGISYGPIATGSGSPFDIRPPASATVVKVATPAGPSTGAAATSGRHAGAKRAHAVSGVAAVAAGVPFTLNAPDQLAGLPRQTVELLDWGSSPAALVTYGQGLGAVVVVEHTVSASTGSTASSSARGSSRRGQAGPAGSALALPTVSIKGVTGQELDTALGTALQFTRGGVSYLVIGSVPAVAAEAAARAL